MANDLTLERWESIGRTERMALARDLARDLPMGSRFKGLRQHRLGATRRSVAEFELDGAAFVLVPGGKVTLGFDARSWEPTEDEIADWSKTRNDFGFRESAQQIVRKLTLRPRKRTIRPLLVEIAPREIGWEPMSLEEPIIQTIIRNEFRSADPDYRLPRDGRVCNSLVWFQGESEIRVERRPDGSMIAQRALPLTHRLLSTVLARAGFRFPSPDEWEYLCGAGATTLFRWGDHAPLESYPIGDEDAEIFAKKWDHHRRPNAFGILIASDPYKYELTSDPEITRGGDGGCNICGGMGYFIGWLPLATAYFDPHACKHKPRAKISVGYTIGRRVLELG